MLHALIYSPYFFPDYVGGGERLVQLTAAGMRANGVDAAILTTGLARQDYTWDGAPVHVVSRHGLEAGAQIHELFCRLHPDVVHMVGSWEQPTVACAARRVRARLGAAGLDYGQFCDNHRLVRGDGRACAGRVSADDCFACTLEGTSRRDGVLGDLGRLLPGRVSSLVETAARYGLGRPMGPQLRWATQFRERDARRLEAARELDLFVVPTRFAEEQTCKHLGTRTRCASLMYPVADELRLREPKRNRRDRLTVGFVGRCLSMKGLHVLFDAVERIADQVPVTLLVETPANEDDEVEYRRSMKGRAATLGVVHWSERGVLDPAGLRAFHSAVDVLAVPSLWPEYVGFVTLEALALGTSVVLSDYPTQRELLADAASGEVVSPGDAAALAMALERAWHRKRLGASGATTCPALSVAEYGRGLLNLYQDVTAWPM